MPFADGLAVAILIVVGVMLLLARAERIMAWLLHCPPPKVPDVAAPTRPAAAVPKRPDA